MYARSAEAAAVSSRIREHKPGAATLLDVACGTGAHLVHFAREFRVEGIDISDDQLAVARTRLPGVELHQGDMTTFDLGRTFDAVTCMFSSIGYVGTLEGSKPPSGGWRPIWRRAACWSSSRGYCPTASRTGT